MQETVVLKEVQMLPLPFHRIVHRTRNTCLIWEA